jgi:hypothetical protein
MSQLINRRNALTLVAGLPALAVPSIAVTATAGTPDPIFARIAAHRAAEKRFASLCVTADEARTEARATAEGTRAADTPRVVVGEARELHTSVKTLKDGTSVFRHKWGKKTGEFYYASNVADIERSAPKGPEREAWIAKRVALLEADAAEIAKAGKDCGLASVEAEQEAASDYVDKLAWDLVDNPPTTVAGVVSLLAYASEYVEEGNEWPEIGDNVQGREGQPYSTSWNSSLHKSLARVLSAGALSVQS